MPGVPSAPGDRLESWKEIAAYVSRFRRVAAIYDIHGNLPALEAVLREVRDAGADHIVIGGDVLPGPMPAECLDLLSGLDVPTSYIRGNGEAGVLAERAGRDSGVPPQYRAAMQWVAAQLSSRHAEAIAAWPKTVRLEIDEAGAVLFCHATPRDEYEIFTAQTAEAALLPVFEPAGVPLVVCGHTHMQFDRRVGRVRVVNAGSAGMPFGEPGAYWLMLGTDVALRRTAYDLAAAAARTRATDYPGADAFAAHSILAPPSAASILEAYARAEIRLTAGSSG
jgi:predicted phosphodiesterase